MEYRNYLRPIIAGLVGIGLIILIIVLLVKAFSGSGSAPLKPLDVTTYAQSSSATATLVMQGPTVLDQDFRQIKISVSQTQSEIDLIQGFQGHIIASHSYPSNAAAFGAFLQSLKQLNFTKGMGRDAGDYRGFCPSGSRYVYSFNDGNTDLMTLWSTSCGGDGNFEGDAVGVRQLFESQIPEDTYSDIINQTQIAQ